MTRVAFDARHLQTVARHRGIGRYARNLLAAWAAEPPEGIDLVLLRLRGFPPPDPQPLPPHGEVRTLRLRRPELSMLAIDPALLSLELAGRCDVYHAVQLSLPAVRRFPAVVTVHDLAPLRWPEHYLRLPHAALGHRVQYALAREAEALIVPSLATRDDVLEHLRVPAARVHVIAEAVDLSFAPPPREEARRIARERLGLETRYVLYVGQFDPRKNMPALCGAFAAAAARDRELVLVIAGALGALATHLWTALAESGASRERVRAVGAVDDATLAALYAGAEALVHPALLEGFGLTPLEAMAAGTPVVAFRAPGVEELVGDAGVLVPLEGGAEALGQALIALLEDEGERMRLDQAGRDRASGYSWSEAARRTAEVYRAVLER